MQGTRLRKKLQSFDKKRATKIKPGGKKARQRATLLSKGNYEVEMMREKKTKNIILSLVSTQFVMSFAQSSQPSPEECLCFSFEATLLSDKSKQMTQSKPRSQLAEFN